MKILVALDWSRYSDQIMETLLEQTAVKGTEIRLLHVLDPFPTKLAQAKGSREYLDFEAAARQERNDAENVLESYVEKLRAVGFHATWLVEEGDAREVIVDSAAVWGADLIMLGSRGKTALRRLLVGSVSESVLHHAKCSVEIVRSGSA